MRPKPNEVHETQNRISLSWTALVLHAPLISLIVQSSYFQNLLGGKTSFVVFFFCCRSRTCQLGSDNV